MIRTYNVKVPFIGYDFVQIDVDDSKIDVDDLKIGDPNLDKACEDFALDKAKDMVWDKFRLQAERFELFNLVEGTNDLSYYHFIELKFKSQVEEITIDEKEEE